MRLRYSPPLPRTKRSEQFDVVVVYTRYTVYRLLQKCSLVHSTKCTERDSQRQVAGKLSLEAAQTSAELEAQRETLAKLTHEVSSLENQLNQVTTGYNIIESISISPHS